MTMSSSSVETRDSAIQMLDKFLAVLGMLCMLSIDLNFLLSIDLNFLPSIYLNYLKSLQSIYLLTCTAIELNQKSVDSNYLH